MTGSPSFRQDAAVLPRRVLARLLAPAIGLTLLPLALVSAPAASPAAAPPADAARPGHHHGHHNHHDHHGHHARRNRAQGVGAWWLPGATTALRRSRASWVYNWAAQPTFRVPHGVRFVPMIWGAQFLTPQQLSDAQKYGPDLLTFNEPEIGSQAYLSVDQALDLWPALEATGLRLSSPAVVNNDALDRHGWLGTFMRKAKRRGLRVDFIAVHWYSDIFNAEGSTRHLRRYLRRVHQTYGLPVWLTEYSLLGWDSLGQLVYPRPGVQARFIARSTRMLDQLPWLERYAWWALPAPDHGRSSGLYRADDRPTRAGRAFRAAAMRRR